MLRGAGVALTLPWLESLARPARAQAAAKRPQRFVAVFIPNGAPDIWMPPVAGKGDAWRLSSVLEPLTPLKSRVTVISGLENGSPFNESGSFSVEPSHGRLPGGWLTCVDGAEVKKRLNVPDANGVSVDQVMAAHPKFAGQTALPSLQIGLSTVHSYCDGVSCSYSRSVSWRTEAAGGVLPNGSTGSSGARPSAGAASLNIQARRVIAACRRWSRSSMISGVT